MADKQEEAPKADGRASRAQIIGSDSGPEAPFPLRMTGKVVSGFGRGSKEVCSLFSISISLFTCPCFQEFEFEL